MKWHVVLCLMPTIALAELPPQYQRQAELLAIIGSNAVDEALAREPIDMVRMTGPDAYVVRSTGCKVNVAIVGIAQSEEIVGARQFVVEVVNTTC